MEYFIFLKCYGRLTTSDSCIAGIGFTVTTPLCGTGGTCGPCQANPDGSGGPGTGSGTTGTVGTQGTCIFHPTPNTFCCTDGSCQTADNCP